MPYFEKIPGERLYLSPIDASDEAVALCTKWLNDIAVTEWLSASNVFSAMCEKNWLEAQARKPDSYQFAIVLREGNRLIGNAGFSSVNLIHRKATLGLFIGEAEDRSKGYGTEALKLLVDYGFRWLGLRNIALDVNAENARGIRCYEKVGFR